MADQGQPSSEIARRIGTTSSQVSVWRRRFVEKGYQGLVNPRLDAKLARNRQKQLSKWDHPMALRIKGRQRGAVAKIKLSPDQREVLLDWAKAPLIENRLAQRARAVLQADDGFAAQAIGNRIMMSPVQVMQWCQRYLEEGQEGLKDRPRSGRPALDLGDNVERIRRLVEEGPPPGHSRWTGNLLAEKLSLPDHMVRKALKAGNIEWRQMPEASKSPKTSD